MRSDDQLVELFRTGNDEAFRVIHDRYRARLLAYTRHMLASGARHEAEDATQDVFVKAYSSLRTSDRPIALRAWLYRVAHNRCIDELRRPLPLAGDAAERSAPPAADPILAAEQRETIRKLIADIRRLPDQQRSALLMRELSGMTYNELSDALGVSVAAVKSLLVRARVGLAHAAEARNIACSEIREELVAAHDRGVRPTGTARRHLHECAGCREFRNEIRGLTQQFAALAPAIGPVAVIAKLFGLGGGAATGGGAAAGGSAAAGGGTAAGGGAAVAAGGGAAVAAGGAIGTGALAAGSAGHVATLLAAALVTAGGAVEIQPSLNAPTHHRAHHHAAASSPASTASSPSATAASADADTLTMANGTTATVTPATGTPTTTPHRSSGHRDSTSAGGAHRAGSALGGMSDPSTQTGSGSGTPLTTGSTGTTGTSGTPGTYPVETPTPGQSDPGAGGSGSTSTTGSSAGGSTGTSGTGTGVGSTSGSGTGSGTGTSVDTGPTAPTGGSGTSGSPSTGSGGSAPSGTSRGSTPTG